MPGLKTRLRRLRERFRVGDPVIHLYCLCWNEARMLPFFFRHYDDLVARYFVYDNGSSDQSASMLARHPKVTLGEFRAAGGSVIREAPAFYETIWRRSRHEADWIFVVNIDEFLYHPDGKDYFRHCIRHGVTIIPATGYEMIAPAFPRPDQNLPLSITQGVRATHMDKLCAFRPDEISRLNYAPGRHAAKPRGRVIAPAAAELKLLHYKYLGASYLVERYAELRGRTPEGDRSRDLGRHYFRDPEFLVDQHRSLMAKAAPVPGLGDPPCAATA